MSLKISDDQSDSDSLSHGPDLLQLNTEQDPFAKMKELRLKNPHNPIISYLNINSVRNKFENFTGMISEYVDVIVLAETKLDDTSSIKDILTLPKASTASFGTNSIAFRGSILWNSTPDVIKSSNTASVFGKNIKNWTGEGCNCNICK